jgi:general secretion pathway protein G
MQSGLISRIGASVVFRAIVYLLIAAVLVSICTPKLGSHPQANHTRAIADIAAISEALDEFKKEAGRYPTTEEGLQALVTPPGSLAAVTSAKLDSIPLDPWQGRYVYRSPGHQGEKFELLCTGPSGEEGNADNIR